MNLANFVLNINDLSEIPRQATFGFAALVSQHVSLPTKTFEWQNDSVHSLSRRHSCHKCYVIVYTFSKKNGVFEFCLNLLFPNIFSPSLLLSKYCRCEMKFLTNNLVVYNLLAGHFHTKCSRALTRRPYRNIFATDLFSGPAKVANAPTLYSIASKLCPADCTCQGSTLRDWKLSRMCPNFEKTVQKWGPFFDTLAGHFGSEGPERFLRFLGDRGPGGPGEPCKWPFGSQPQENHQMKQKTKNP